MMYNNYPGTGVKETVAAKLEERAEYSVDEVQQAQLGKHHKRLTTMDIFHKSVHINWNFSSKVMTTNQDTIH